MQQFAPDFSFFICNLMSSIYLLFCCPSFFYLHLLLIERKLLYNMALVSVIHQQESATGISRFSWETDRKYQSAHPLHSTPVLHLLRVTSDEPASLPSRTFFAVSQRLCTTPYSDRSFSPSKAPLNAHSHHVSLPLSLSYFFFRVFFSVCLVATWHGMWEPSLLPRDRTLIPGIGSAES